ncbi:MAG: lipopolysaccharide kinase [Legionellales bacterium]|nr:lipopolysaccharide kinase [Legionellales bacterium]
MTGNYFEINPDYKNFTNMVKNIDRVFETSGSYIHRGRNAIKSININGVDVIVKSFRLPNPFNRFFYSLFNTSKAKRSYDNSTYLIKSDINCPTPIAFVEDRSWMGLRKSYYLSTRIDCDFTMEKVIYNNECKDRTMILKQMMDFIIKLHAKNIYHKDLSPGNILVTKTGPQKYEFFLVDLNRMTFKRGNLRDAMDNIYRLIHDWWSKYNYNKADLHFFATIYAEKMRIDQQVVLNTLKRSISIHEKRHTLKTFFNRLRKKR